MNFLRLGTSHPLTSSSEGAELPNEEVFRQMISLESKRSKRSRKPFILMLLDTGDQHPLESNRQTLRKIATALSVTARETDLTGWYRNDRAIGVIFTEIGFANRSATLTTMMSKVSNILRTNLALEQFTQLSISFHVFPENWDHGADRRPSNPTLYPDLTDGDESRGTYYRGKRVMDIVGV